MYKGIGRAVFVYMEHASSLSCCTACALCLRSILVCVFVCIGVASVVVLSWCECVCLCVQCMCAVYVCMHVCVYAHALSPMVRRSCRQTERVEHRCNICECVPHLGWAICKPCVHMHLSVDSLDVCLCMFGREACLEISASFMYAGLYPPFGLIGFVRRHFGFRVRSTPCVARSVLIEASLQSSTHPPPTSSSSTDITSLQSVREIMASLQAIEMVGAALYETASIMWTELAMFGVAALCYVFFVGGLPIFGKVGKPSQKKGNHAASRASAGGASTDPGDLSRAGAKRVAAGVTLLRLLRHDLLLSLYNS